MLYIQNFVKNSPCDGELFGYYLFKFYRFWICICEWEQILWGHCIKKGKRESSEWPVCLISAAGNFLKFLMQNRSQSVWGWAELAFFYERKIMFYKWLGSLRLWLVQLIRGKPVDAAYVWRHMLTLIEKWSLDRKQRIGINGSFSGWQPVNH